MVDGKLNNIQRAKFHIVLDEETFNLMNECKEEFLKHHPEEDGKNITNKHITKQTYLHYLRTP